MAAVCLDGARLLLNDAPHCADRHGEVGQHGEMAMETPAGPLRVTLMCVKDALTSKLLLHIVATAATRERGSGVE